MAQDIQVLGKRDEKDKLTDINLTRSVVLNDLTQEQLRKIYRIGTVGALYKLEGFNFDCSFEANVDGKLMRVAANVNDITFDSAKQAVVFNCGYSTTYDKFIKFFLYKKEDGTYYLLMNITAPVWVDKDDIKTINGQSIVGTGDIEIKGGGDATPTGTTLYFTTTDGQTLNANIQAKNKAGTVIEPSLKTPTAWYYDEIVETMGFPSKTENCNLYSLNGVNIPVSKVINNYYTNSVIRKIMQNCRYADLRKFFFSGYSGELSTMFWGAKNLEWVDIPNLNTYKTTKMDKMFEDCSGLTTLDVSNWNTSQVTDMSDMFHGCRSLTSLDVSKWNTSKVKNMNNMFMVCSSLTYLDVSHFDVSQIKYMSSMFQGCSGLASLDVSKWDTSKFVYMNSIFAFCSALTSLDLSNWNTSQVTDMSGLFRECGRLTSLDLSNWDLTNLTSMGSMFEACNSLKTITAKNCNQTTIDKLKAALTSANILKNVTIITE